MLFTLLLKSKSKTGKARRTSFGELLEKKINTVSITAWTYTLSEKRENEISKSKPSCVSVKSDQSVDEPTNFRSGDSALSQFPKPSCVSIKSDQSVDEPTNFSSGDSSAVVGKQLDSIFKELEHKSISLMKKELKMFKKLLSPDYPECSASEEEEQEEEVGQNQVREGTLKITLHVLRKMNQTELANNLHIKHAPFCMKKHKSRLKRQFQRISEGMSNKGNSRPLREIYTELYVTEGEGEEVNNEHEVRQIEMESRRPGTLETRIECNDIFRSSPGQNKSIRTVMTKGIAGIGKTVSVQKFILDWAEGRANRDVHFIFPLPFRELNLMMENNITLMELLYQFFNYTKELSKKDFDDFKVLFIFDGLDECQLPLDFWNNDVLCDMTESASVDVLLTNLIKGNLLPSALLWITSRPAAASQIPPECVDQVTEVRGFNDPQKDEYFMKRISDQSLASRIITHIKSSRSLYIMCHIPVFCWISATVLERVLSEAENAEIPKTLTQMFTYFLAYQIKLKTQKYDGKYEVDLQQAKKNIFSLGKLAFEQLEKGNLIFYEEDLRQCGVDVTEASVYSGLCTQIFREELGQYLGKVYSFVHLSFQEFLAALFNLLFIFQDNETKRSITDLLKSEIDKALQSKNGHWDLYLRFLLGLLLESSQTPLQVLLTQTGSRSDSKQEIVNYIKMKLKEDPSPEKSINLFYCLNEMNDQSLVKEVQKYLSRSVHCLSGAKLCPAQWSALVFVLLNSENDHFKLSKFCKSEEGLLRLMPVVKASRYADLSDCNLTEKSCSALALALKSSSSCLRGLELNYNNMQGSRLNLLSDGLKNPHCKLETLKLYNCNITGEGFATLTAALRSNPSHLRELILSWNTLEDSGMKLFSDLLQDPHCKLEKLQLSHCNIGEEGCASLVSALRSNPSHLRELNLNNNTLGDSGVNLLSNLLKDQHCKLANLQLEFCSFGEEGSASLASALRSNPSHLRELNLSENKLGDSGVELLSNLLNDPHCKLERLYLCCCSISEKGCDALIAALSSNPSHLRELNLSRNNTGDSAVNLLSDLLKDPNCKLEKLQLEFCCIGEEGCAALVSAKRSKKTHLKELNLNYNKIGDSGIKLNSGLQMDPHCKIEKLPTDSLLKLSTNDKRKPKQHCYLS
ncbi:NACHT, LRR and PYD domains-containing protein 3-like isoform X2 [Puntigrus tetrazona]|uniref:NACHT, LRR and PYD domains-containing protein 3-like isoform X2 n=1 Tax=Puntigrus tetrazona TaxID=1606681 RepID=UPI001C89CCF3|nr:NACHT, LRR and PYD domains-containing protein 3-like isoform X2 [Puntigrus tetrazona]